MPRRLFLIQRLLFIPRQLTIKMKFKKLIFIFVFFAVFLTLLSSKVKAQEENQSAIAVGPAILEEILIPGQTHQAKVVVSNITNSPLPIKSSVRNFLQREEVPLDSLFRYDASAWIYVNPPDFILQPTEKKEVTITIETPPDAAPGGHYATVYFEPLVPMIALSPKTTYSLARVGVLAFLVVSGEINEKGFIEEIKGRKFSQSGPIELKVSFKNEGNVHLLPSGKIFLTDWRGREVAVLISKPALVLPNTSRDLVFVWEKKYPIGKFQAEVELIFGSEQIKSSLEGFNFWIIPVVPFLLPLFLLTTIFIVVILKRERFILALKILFGKNIKQNL